MGKYLLYTAAGRDPLSSPINTPLFLSYGYSPFGGTRTGFAVFKTRIPPERIYLLLILNRQGRVCPLHQGVEPFPPSRVYPLSSSINERLLLLPHLPKETRNSHVPLICRMRGRRTASSRDFARPIPEESRSEFFRYPESHELLI